MPLAHRRAPHLRRPQSQRDRPKDLFPFLLRTARRTTRFVCGRHEARRAETADSSDSNRSRTCLRCCHARSARTGSGETKRRARHERAPSASPSGREHAVMDRLTRDLERADAAIVLSDDRARVVDRRVPDDAVCRSLDAAVLMPGCSIERGAAGRTAASIATRDRAPIPERTHRARRRRRRDPGRCRPRSGCRPRRRRLAPAPLRMGADPARFVGTRTCSREVHPVVSPASSSGRITRMGRRTHESTAKLSKPLELHMRHARLGSSGRGCRGSTGRFGGVM